MDLSKLKEPFSSDDIDWRVQSSGIKNGKPWAVVLAYIQSRAIMDRLDDVCGPENWKNSYHPAPDKGIMCALSIKVDNEWITKEDGAENTEVEAVKGGISSALKRAGVPWGIGRYLYKLDVGFAVFADNGKYTAKIKDGNGFKYFKWNPPKLPTWALPKNAKPVKEEDHPKDEKSEKEVFFNKWYSWIDDVGKKCKNIDDFESAISGVSEQLATFTGKYRSDISNLIEDIRKDFEVQTQPN